MNVVDLDGRRRAANEAETAAAAYLLSRQADELAAIRRARVRRIARSRITWAVVTVALCSTTAFITHQITAEQISFASAQHEQPAALEPVSVAQSDAAAGDGTAIAQTVAETDQQDPILAQEPPPADQASPQGRTPTAAVTPFSGLPSPVPGLPVGELPRIEWPDDAASVPTAAPAVRPVAAQQASRSLKGGGGETQQRPATTSTSRGFVSYEAKSLDASPRAAPQVVSPPSASNPRDTTGHASTPAADSTGSSVPPQSKTIAVEFAIVGAPTDEVVLIKHKGEGTVRPVRLGQPLPNGEMVLFINPAEKRVRTDRRTVVIDGP